MLTTARDELVAGMSKRWDDGVLARMMGQIQENIQGNISETNEDMAKKRHPR
jgi:hypothetical protein